MCFFDVEDRIYQAVAYLATLKAMSELTMMPDNKAHLDLFTVRSGPN